MSADTYQVISVVGFALAAVFFVIAVILFFKMDIRGIIGDLTGKTAAKRIAELRNSNYSEEAVYKGSHVYDKYENSNSSGLGKIKATKNIQMSHPSRRLDISSGELKAENKKYHEYKSEEFNSINESATEVLDYSQSEQSTVLLSKKEDNFEIIFNLVVTHSDEII